MKPNCLIAMYSTLAMSLVIIPACEKKPASSPGPGSNAANGHEHGPGGGHTDAAAGHGGPIIQLGTTTIGPFNVKATRDEGQIIAGKDAPIDLTVTATADSTVKVSAVRLWIGTENARGSVKARAEIENPAEPNRWHTHAEIPNPLPEGSKLWVEIEDSRGGKNLGSFNLKL